MSLTSFQNTFVPLLVAMNPVTVLPVYLAMTEGMTTTAMRDLSKKAVLTAFCVAFGITLTGQALFRLLGITVNDLRIGGGLILLSISTYDLIFSREQRKQREVSSDVGVVPLGTPLIVGPATMTACLVLVDTQGRWVVLLSLLLNLAITFTILYYADYLRRWVSPAVARAFGKVMSLFLAAIAVAMMRVGVTAFISGKP